MIDWYGDSNKANKMSGEDLKPVYYNNLKILNFSNGKNISTNFNFNNFK